MKKRNVVISSVNYHHIIRNGNILKTILLLFIMVAAGLLARAADGDVDASFEGSALRLGAVYTTAVQPDGKILIGGNFYAAGGAPRLSIARLNADGTPDATFRANLSGIVQAILVEPDGKILVGGAVQLNLPTRQRSNFFRLNPDGSSDDAYNAGAGVTGGTVYALARQADGKILVGGNFSGVNGFFRSGLLRFNTDGSWDSAFAASAYGDSANEGVYAMTVQADGRIAIAGDFTFVNDAPRNGVARLNSNGTVDTSFAGNVSATNRRVYGLAVQPDNKIIICGFFNQVNGLARNKIVRFNTDGSLDTSFQGDIPTALYSARTVRLQADGRILVGGFFATINATPKSNIARLFSNGTLDTSFTAATDGTVYDIYPSDNPLIVGEFTKVNNIDSFGVSRTDNSGNRDNGFNVGVGTIGSVRKVVAQADGKLLVGGEFTHFANSPRRNIARLDADGQPDASFNPGTGFEAGSRVNDLAVLSGSKIAVAGNFNSYNGATQRLIVVLNADGSRDAAFNANFTQTGEIRKLVPFAGGKLLIIGSFRFGSDTQTTGFAMLNADGSRDASFAPVFAPAGAAINSAAVQADGKIIVVGSFTSVNGTAKNYIARLNADGSLDNSLTLSTPNYNQSAITEVQVQPDGKILISGAFQRSDTPTFFAAGLMRLNPDGSRDLSFNIPFGKTISGSTFAVQPDGRILVLMTYNFDFRFLNTIKTFVARLRPNGTLDYSFNINLRGIPNTSAVINSLAVLPDNKIIVGGSFTDYSAVTRISLARIENSPLPPDAPFDFDGDGGTDISIFRPSLGEWWINRSGSGQTVAAQFGAGADKPVPADYTGDGKTDIAFFRPSSGEWYILRSENGSFLSFPFGAPGDVPVVGDFDADGRADPTIFRPSTATWYILRSTGGVGILSFGLAGDVPVAADYDGDDKTDIAIWRPSNGQWWISRSSSNVAAVAFGTATDKPVVGDFSGDGRADIAFFRPSTGEWFVVRSEDASYYSVPFGAAGDIPAPGDYDGDGIFDTAVFRPSGSTWYIQRSTAGILIRQFGLATDTPVPSVFVP